MKKNTGQFKKGLIPWNKGRSPSKETREKLRNFNLGKKHSLETKLLLSKKFSGANNAHWKGGIKALKDIVRRGFLYRQWRSDCMQRDDFTCVICSKRGGELNVDHFPKTFSSILVNNDIKSTDDANKCSELWDMNNGRTLCIECHRKTFTYPKPFTKI